jgi:hypothetical protein
MFSFLNKINSKKSQHQLHQSQSNTFNGTKESNRKLSKLKSSECFSSSSGLDANVENYEHHRPASIIQSNRRSGLLSLTLRNGLNSSSLKSKLNEEEDNQKEFQQTKSPFSRKANLSLASISSGYFTTGRLDKKKLITSSLGYYLNIFTQFRIFNRFKLIFFSYL